MHLSMKTTIKEGNQANSPSPRVTCSQTKVLFLKFGSQGVGSRNQRQETWHRGQATEGSRQVVGSGEKGEGDMMVHGGVP